MSEKATLNLAEVAALTGFSRQTISRLFENEPGVIIVSRPEKMYKRRYRSIRIPRAVYERVCGDCKSREGGENSL